MPNLRSVILIAPELLLVLTALSLLLLDFLVRRKGALAAAGTVGLLL